MEIPHPWHAHPLFLSDGTKYEDKCSICEKRFDGNPFYACFDCKYYVHKSCAQLPVVIQHHSHPLSLNFGTGFYCDSCHKRFDHELHFSCSICDYDLDVKCALMSDIDTEGKEFISHFTHQHPLTICSKDDDNPLNCFACKKTSSDLIYGCTPCDYFLHKSCSELSTPVLHAMHPQHALTLVVKFARCNYCKRIDHTWKYYCRICEYFLDVSCLVETAKDTQNSGRSCFLWGKQHLDSDSFVDSLHFINQSCIRLPVEIEHEFHSHKPLLLIGRNDFECDSCHKWFNAHSHYGCEECDFRMDIKCALMQSVQYDERDESIWPVIPHHFNHQHPLQLIKEVRDINCSACHATKLSPMYGCVKCEYFLHQFCLELPIQIKHPFHDSHVLTIQPLGNNFCLICCKKYIGFSFGCNQCLVFIGIECIWELGSTAVLNYHPTVEYKYHPHLLCLIERSYSNRCDADNTFCQFSEDSSEFELTKSYSLRCIECDYNLHFLCGPLPCIIKHKSHLHAMKLVDSIVEDDSDEHYCDICEEIRNPRLCVYYCEDCKYFTHIHCVISEIINVFKKNSEKVKLRIVGDLRFGVTTNSSNNNLTEKLLLDLLKGLDANDILMMQRHFPERKLFPDSWERPEQKSSSRDDDTMDIIEELSFYSDDISDNIEKRFKLFKPGTNYHIQHDECELPVIEVEGCKVTSNFATIFRSYLMKYVKVGHPEGTPAIVNPVLLYFFCRVLKSMSRTFVVDITENQLFTWHYYINRLARCGLAVEFVYSFLERTAKSYYGLRAMKFENEAPGKLDRKILNLEQKISDIKTQIEELKWHRQQHRVGKLAEESATMRMFFTEAKKQKWQVAGEGLF